MISRLIGYEVHRIEAADRYPDDYDRRSASGSRTLRANARPEIANPLTTIVGYDTVILGSPIWNVRAPMIMTTLVEGLDFGKTVHPLTTYAMSGLGTTERDYAASCRGATLAEGLAVRGEEVADAQPAVEAWPRRFGLSAPLTHSPSSRVFGAGRFGRSHGHTMGRRTSSAQTTFPACPAQNLLRDSQVRAIAATISNPDHPPGSDRENEGSEAADWRRRPRSGRRPRAG
jgi:hypothetical protein